MRKLTIIFGYIAAFILVIGATLGLVAYGQGYSYNFGQHRIVRNGLVIVSSQPSGARVTVDSKTGRKKTPYRATLEAGSYRYHVTKDGYTAWEKVLNVVASEVTLAQYILLIPSHLVTTHLDSHSAVGTQAISRDHTRLAYIVTGTDGGLYVMDLTDPKPSRIYTPLTATPTAGAETLTDVSWSDDGSHLLLGSTTDAGRVVRLISLSNNAVIDLTAQYGQPFDGLTFSGNNWHLSYWIAPDGLKRFDASSQTISGVLATNVTQIVMTTGDRVLFVQNNDQGESLWSIDSHDHKQELIPALVKSDHYTITYSSYQGDDVLGVVPSSNGIGTLYTRIFSSDPEAKVVAHNVTSAAFSPDGHFVTFYSPTVLTTYDLEQSNAFATTVSYNAAYAADQAITALSWYDNYHLLLSQGGKVRIAEYDGQNSVALGAARAGSTSYRIGSQKTVEAVAPVVAGGISKDTITATSIK